MQKESNDIEAVRHSLAHLLAAAVMKLWPDTKRTIGPAIDDGFYFDFEFSHPITDSDLPRIEAEMRRIMPSWDKFERYELNREAAKKEYPNNEYKQELIDDFTKNGEKVTFYKSGDYWDLCRGGHVTSMKQVDPGSFKLDKVAGAYWRGDEKNKMLTRIYGLAFSSKEELSAFIEMREEAKRRDHRKLGRELDLFTISDLVGPGLPLFTPRGAVLRDGLASYSLELQSKIGFQQVWTPHMARTELYKYSGHYDKYPERFEVTSAESDDVFMLKPMNCPHHAQLFARKAWSYRELPVRYMENTTNYRDEKSGELHGLSRVRSLSQDDGHIFCREEDIEHEVAGIVAIVKDLYNSLNLSYYARLSYRDNSDKYLGDPELWKKAEALIAKVAKAEKLDTVDGYGEAAFYGPKIDFMVKDSLGREWQCATVQIDFVQPERFGLSYSDADGSEKRPVMIHKALLGSIERFLSVYIEHTGGRFPVWLSPEQIRLITVNQEPTTTDFAKAMEEKAKELGLRIVVDNSNESVSKKIRNAEMLRIPYAVVVGEQEITSGKVEPRIRQDIAVNDKHTPIELGHFLQSVANEVKSRASHSSL